MVNEYLVLLLTDALLYLLARTVATSDHVRYAGALPLWLSLTFCIGAVAGHGGASVILSRAVTDPGMSGLVMVSVILLGVVPIGLFIHLVSESIVHIGTREAYGWTRESQRVDPVDLREGHRYRRQNDLANARKEYRQCFDNNPADPRPLFAMAEMFEESNQHDEAIRVYRTIVARFAAEDVSWSRAAIRLSELVRETLYDEGAADTLLKEIVRRLPDSTIGRAANARLKRKPVRIELASF